MTADQTPLPWLPTASRPAPLVVAFGDSITATSADMAESDRWPARLEAALRQVPGWAAARVVNAGVGGNTSREGLARCGADVLPHRPDLVLVQFGGNDATPDPQRHVHLVEYERNLSRIEAAVNDAGCLRLAVLTFPPIVDRAHAWYADFAPVGGQDAFVESYRQATRRHAGQRRVHLFDLDRVVRAAPANYILPDGVHLSVAGNEVVATALAPRVVAWLQAGCSGGGAHG
jgi:lysophospholipase L1-like esterase